MLSDVHRARCSAVKTASTELPAAAIVDNVMAVLNAVAKVVPGGWNNVQSICVKTTTSIALPIYSNLPEGRETPLPAPPKSGKQLLEELDFDEDAMWADDVEEPPVPGKKRKPLPAAKDIQALRKAAKLAEQQQQS